MMKKKEKGGGRARGKHKGGKGVSVSKTGGWIPGTWEQKRDECPSFEGKKA